MENTKLTVQTWNCFGTAMDVRAVLRRRGAPDAHRLTHPDVREELERVDVLCVQELWIPDAVELFDSLSFEHRVRDSNESRLVPLTMGGSGLGIATRWPVVAHEVRAFRERGWGTDRGARKGVLHARVRVADIADREVDIFTTHVQAGSSRQSQIRRARQLTEIREAVDDLGAPDRPALLCGDLNIDGLAAGRSAEYGRLVELFPDLEDLGAGADEPTMCPDPKLNPLAHRYWSAEPLQRLDYLLYRPAQPGWLAADGVERSLDRQLSPHDGPATYPSDHFGMRASFRVG